MPDEYNVDFELLKKVVRGEPETPGITFDDFVEALYKSWWASCEPETHLDLERAWRMMTKRKESPEA